MKREGNDKPNSKDSSETKRQKQLTAFEEDAATIGALLQEAQDVAETCDTDGNPLEGINGNGEASIPHGNNNSNNNGNMHVIRDDMPQAPGINGNGHALPNNGRFAPSTSDADDDNADDEEARDWLSAPETRRAPRVGNDFQAVLPGPGN